MARPLTSSVNRSEAETLFEGERRILEMVAKGDALPLVLDAVCCLVEEIASGVLASVLLVDGDRLRHGAAPSLPKDYIDAIDGGLIGPRAGSCGTAAFSGEQVIVSDIASDALWADFRATALRYSLRACWSTPITSSENRVIGTFAMYYREPRRPRRRDQDVIAKISHLARVAIERELTHERLQRSEAYLAEAQKLTHVGSFGWDISRRKVYWSEETFRIFECDRADRLTAELILQRTHPDDRVRVQQTIDRVRDDKEAVDFEYRLQMPDGKIKSIHIVGHPILNGSSDFVEFVGAVTDVTELRRAEKEHQALAHANRMETMGHLSASIAHEVNQPLSGIVTCAETAELLLKRESPNVAEALRALGRITRDARRASDIVGRVRALTKKAPLQKDSVDLNEAILEVIALTHGETVKNSVAVKKKLAKDLPIVQGDRVQLQQVMLNLIINAVEAMTRLNGRPRELVIGTSRIEADEVLVTVRDSGLGPDSEKPERMFEAFYTTKPNGLGMGLAICRSIIEAHGGKLWATTGKPHGAVFQFNLPSMNTPLGGTFIIQDN